MEICSVDLVERAKVLCEERKICMKCGIRPAFTVARVNDPFCMDCFDVYFTHRFRATFGKAKIVRQGEKVLVGFTGGSNSRVLLKLIEDGLHIDAPKKLRFVPTLIHIDENVLRKGDMDCEQNDSVSVLNIANQTTFPIIYTRLEEVLGSCSFWYLKDIFDQYDAIAARTCVQDKVESSEKSCTISCSHSSYVGREITKHCIKAVFSTSEKLQVEIRQLFDSVRSLSVKENLLHLIRRKVFQRIASRLGFSKVLVGENASLLSVCLLSNVAEGRGSTVPLDTDFCDDRGEVMILRPLREFPSSEVQAFCELKGLKTVKLDEMFTDDPSIKKLTKTFIDGLQKDFPSTVNTIFRTGEKLSLDESNSLHKCPLCQVPVGHIPDKDVFTHTVLKNTAIVANLCYGCCLMTRDMVLNTEVILSLVKLQ